MDRPSETQMIEGLVMLHMLGAIDGNGDVTDIGREMSKFPLEPNLSRMLYEASRSVKNRYCTNWSREENNCLEEIATICAMLSVENVYFYPKRFKSDQKRLEEHLQSKKGDSVTMKLESEMEKHEAVDAHMRLWKSDGDHFTLLNIYHKWLESGNRKFRTLVRLIGCTLNWCESSFIRFSAMKLAKNIRYSFNAKCKFL